jgi:hypothetical protein
MTANALLALDLQRIHVCVSSTPDLGQHGGQIQAVTFNRWMGIILNAGDQPSRGQIGKRAPRESLVTGSFSDTHQHDATLMVRQAGSRIGEFLGQFLFILAPALDF